MFDIQLLACSHITEAARKELARAGCPIHKDVLWGDFEQVEIVELQHAGDLQMMLVWGTPRELQIPSRGLYLHYHFSETHNGYELALLDEDESETSPLENTSLGDESDVLGDLDDHPF
jgi:hypothetical protein